MRALSLPRFVLFALALVCATGTALAAGSDAALFKPDVPPGPTGDTFKFVVMADSQPHDERDLVATPREFFLTIREVNAVAPVFSVICGDLLYGYTDDVEVLGRMWDSFLESIQQFEQPLFCVIGNHDVSQAMHEEYFTKRFGDLRWYSFDYGPAHFIVLDSEEAGSIAHLTDAQLEWLKADLEKSQKQGFKFVFLHKPYAHFGEQWETIIHPLLAKYGATAVFAGHWHTYQFTREQDGVRYYVLPACGGHDLDDEFIGFARGFMEVTVGPKGVEYVLNFRGRVLPDDYVTAAQAESVWALRDGQAVTSIELPPIDAVKGMDGTARVELTNPTPYDIEYELRLGLSPEATIKPVGAPTGTLGPDAKAVHEFRVVCPCPSDETRPFPQVVVKGSYLVTLPHVTGRVASTTGKTRACAVPDELPAESQVDRYAKLDGRTACVEIPFFDELNARSPFTIEAWFRVDEMRGLAGGFAHTDVNSYGLLLSGYDQWEPEFLVCDASTGRYVEAKGEARTPSDQWVHIACTRDSETIAIWIDGEKVAETDAPGEIVPNYLPMYIGADPVGPEPGSPENFLGGCVDEFRFSTICRYTEEFTPAKRFEADEDTLILYHLDRVLVNRIVDYSGNGHHGVLLGEAELIER